MYRKNPHGWPLQLQLKAEFTKPQNKMLRDAATSSVAIEKLRVRGLGLEAPVHVPLVMDRNSAPYTRH
jgi:hypothetical protein